MENPTCLCYDRSRLLERTTDVRIERGVGEIGDDQVVARIELKSQHQCQRHSITLPYTDPDIFVLKTRLSKRLKE